MSDVTLTADYLELTAEIVSAYLRNNATAAGALSELIHSVYRSVASQSGSTDASKPSEKPKPAVAVNRSVFPDHLVCLEDGKKFKMLKRYLRRTYGMTPEAYRMKWGLPSSYPMVAPDYASRRSALAKEIAFGRKKVDSHPEPQVTQIRARRARGSRG